MDVEKKNSGYSLVLDIRTCVLRVVVDSRGALRFCAPLDTYEEPTVEYKLDRRCCA